MPKNTLSDLNNHLFVELERLGDESLDAEQLKVEISRTNAMKDVASSIVSNSRLMLDAIKHRDAYGNGTDMNRMLQ